MAWEAEIRYFVGNRREITIANWNEYTIVNL